MVSLPKYSVGYISDCGYCHINGYFGQKSWFTWRTTRFLAIPYRPKVAYVNANEFNPEEVCNITGPPKDSKVLKCCGNYPFRVSYWWNDSDLIQNQCCEYDDLNAGDTWGFVDLKHSVPKFQELYD